MTERALTNSKFGVEAEYCTVIMIDMILREGLLRRPIGTNLQKRSDGFGTKCPRAKIDRRQAESIFANVQFSVSAV
jgi:hypothetical protein